jgi:hypothetical protein
MGHGIATAFAQARGPVVAVSRAADVVVDELARPGSGLAAKGFGDPSGSSDNGYDPTQTTTWRQT